MRPLNPCFRALLLLLCLLLTLTGFAEGKISLPDNLTVIESEAFAGVPIDSLVIPEGVLRIESRAFADSGLKSVTLPESLTYLSPDAFDGCDDLYVTAVPGSYAARLCEEAGIPMNTVVGLNVYSRTQEEILSFIESHPVNSAAAVTFRRAPAGGRYSSGNHAPGLLSDASNENALNMLNQYRFIAGLNADVVIDPTLEEMMGAASLVHALNGTISHYPSRPAALSDAKYDELYSLACTAASSSNLGAGYSNLVDSLYRGYMYDSNSSNISTLGHRRWILNPTMGKTAFGFYADSRSLYRYFSGMYAFDRSGKGGQNLVAWPAQQTPLSHFYSASSHAWSLSFGYFIDAYTMNVTLTRRRDGKTWQFNTDASDGTFVVNNGYYGQPGCVIFQPDSIGTIRAGDIFDVSVLDGTNHRLIKYSVEFF